MQPSLIIEKSGVSHCSVCHEPVDKTNRSTHWDKEIIIHESCEGLYEHKLQKGLFKIKCVICDALVNDGNRSIYTKKLHESCEKQYLEALKERVSVYDNACRGLAAVAAITGIFIGSVLAYDSVLGQSF